MTEHGRKSLGLEHIILHHIASKTDSKDSNENTQNHNTKKCHPKCCDGKKRDTKLSLFRGMICLIFLRVFNTASTNEWKKQRCKFKCENINQKKNNSLMFKDALRTIQICLV